VSAAGRPYQVRTGRGKERQGQTFDQFSSARSKATPPVRAPMLNSWTGGEITFGATKTIDGSARPYSRCIEATSLGLQPGGLLHEALLDAPSPVHINYVARLAEFVPRVCADAKALEVLNTPARQLASEHIRYLYGRFDLAAEESNYDDKASAATQASRLLRYCQSRLKTGELVLEIGHKTRLSHSTTNEKRTLSSYYAAAQPTEFLRQPLNVLQFADPHERESRGLEHLKARANQLAEACRKALDEHDALVERLQEVKAAGLPAALHPRLLDNLRRGRFPSAKGLANCTAAQRLAIALFLVERHRLYSSYDPRFSLPLMDCPEFQVAACPCTQLECRAIVLADYFIPRQVVFACLVLVLSATAWNTHTALALSAGDVSDSGTRITLTAPKGRTNQLQSAEISKASTKDEALTGTAERDTSPPVEVADALTLRAIRHLLSARANIDRHAPSMTASLFAVFDVARSGPLRFDIPTLGPLRQQFFSRNGLPRYRLDDVRAHCASIKFLESGRNIFKVQAFLGHADAATTTLYLKSHLLQALNEASMVRYMALLANCIHFACGQPERLSPTEKEGVQHNNLLLFPVSALEESDESCLADEWLGQTADSIEITEDEIQHCILQRIFYRNSVDDLIQASHKRFREVHFPRIVFCEALYRHIAISEYRSLLTRLEQEFTL